MTIFSNNYIGVTKYPIIIVGEKPNKTRDGSTLSLTGNRTGDFVHEAIGPRENIILTNVVNELYPGEFDKNKGIAEGILNLISLIELHRPRKIICLGEIASTYIRSISIITGEIVDLKHPSWVNRFKHGERADYIKFLQDELDK